MLRYVAAPPTGHHCLFLFYDLFNGTVSSSECIGSYGGLVCE
jgi:hypothetical protein